MKLIVGLGNPGSEYRLTRHNVGFMVIDRLALKFNIKLRTRKYCAVAGQGEIGTQKVILAKSLTYMNLSGKSLKKLIGGYKSEIEDLIVIHDDVDLKLGKLKFKEKGGAGGHNGIKSIIQFLNTNEFVRFRVGIGRPVPGQETADYVLEKFTKPELEIIDDVIEKAVMAVEILIQDGISEAMNLYH